MRLRLCGNRRCIVIFPSPRPLLPAAVAVLLLVSALFGQEDYGTWPDSVNIVINTSGSGANVSQNVWKFPVLVRLNPSLFKGFAKTLPDGADIRFAKPDGTPLVYEIERWKNGADNADTAEVWVLLDVVFGDSASQFFRMYYGKSGVTSKSNPAAVFDYEKNDYWGVWHLAEAGNGTKGNFKDATGYFHGTGYTLQQSSVPGAIGMCQQFDGSSDYIKFGMVETHNFSEYTVTMWVRGKPGRDKRIFSETDTTNVNSIFSLGTDDDSATAKMEAFARDDNGAAKMNHSASTADVFNDTWHHVAWVDDDGSYTMYVDGRPSGSGEYEKNYKILTTASIGAVARATSAAYYFAGSIDELTLAAINRTADWIKLSYETQKAGATCVCIPEQAPPAITKHPSDVAASIGSAATMTAEASGPPPLTYCWYKNSVTPGTAIASQTTNTLTITTVKISDTGSYLCVARNDYGSATSDPGKLTVSGAKPGITAHPGDTAVFANNPWSMSVTATGDPAPSYSWYKTGNAAKLGSGSVYAAPPAQMHDSGSYYCVVANPFGESTSNTARLTVHTGSPDITNPIFLRGTFRDSTHVQLTIDNYSSLPAAPTSLFPWYADTVMLWYRTGSFPSGTPSSSAAALKLPLSTMKATPGDTFVTALALPAIGSASYYFKGSVQWKNVLKLPPKDSLPPFGGDASGAIVYMCDTSRLKNPLTLHFDYRAPDTVKVTVGSLDNPALRWNLIAGAVLEYSVAGGTYTPIGLAIQKGGAFFVQTVADPDFVSPEKKVAWRLWLKGVNKNASDTVTASCKVGIPRPENTIKAACAAIGITQVTLSWSRSVPAVDKIRIWYGTREIGEDPAPSPVYSSVTVPGGDTAAAVGPLEASTLYHFGLQVQLSGVWSVIPDQAKTSATTLPMSPNAQPIANSIRFDTITFDPSANRLHFTWTVDTTAMQLYAGIVWKAKGDTGQFPQPGAQPQKGPVVEMQEYSKPLTASLEADGSAIAFGKEYLFGIWLQKPNTPWSKPTAASTRSFYIPEASAAPVFCFKGTDTAVTAFGGRVILKKIVPIGINALIHAVTPPPSLPGLIPLSGLFRFEAENPQAAPLRFGLRYDTIPQGFTVNDIRMYHYDSTNKTAKSFWYVDTVPERDAATNSVSIPILASKAAFPFLLAIDTLRPVADTAEGDSSAIEPGAEIFLHISVTDNIANPEIMLLAGRGDDSLVYKKLMQLQELNGCKIPGGYAEGDCGMRILLVANDGRLADTADLSRDFRISDADIVTPEHEKWMPLAASVTLDSADPQKALDEYTQPGRPWEYDKMTFRLYQWRQGNWLEYSPPEQNRFTFIPGRVTWLKTRKVDRLISLGNGRTVSLKRPYAIVVPGNNWTDFALPYRFNIRIGDIVSATDSLASNELQFYVWRRDQKGRFYTREFYLPSNSQQNDKKSELTYKQNSERMVYSVFNPLPRDVVLRIPGTPVALSDIPAERTKKTTGWSIAIRPRTQENEELSPVFCAYRSNGGGSAAYPLPPSWSMVRVGIYEAGSKRVYGNVIRGELVNGGCAYQLVFENSQTTTTRISCAIEYFTENNIAIGILDPANGAVCGADSALTVEVGAQSRQYRWLAVGSPGYVEQLTHDLTIGEFALSRIAPNPFRGMLRVEFTIPYGGIESVRCEFIDQLGRVVWSARGRGGVRPGRNEFVWNPQKKAFAAGTYIVRLTGFDGRGIKKEERLSRAIYIP